MQITLNQSEIEQAVLNHIAALGISVKQDTASMKFTAGRGDVGISVDIEVQALLQNTLNSPQTPQGKVNRNAGQDSIISNQNHDSGNVKSEPSAHASGESEEPSGLPQAKEEELFEDASEKTEAEVEDVEEESRGLFD